MNRPRLTLNTRSSLRPCGAGLFVSRGEASHPIRTIDSHELIFVREGTLGMFEAERRFSLHAGQTLLLFPGREHGGAEPYPKDLRFYWVHFQLENGGRRRSDTRDTVTVPQVASVARPDRLAELFHRYLDDQESAALTPLSGRLLIMQMMCEAAMTPAAPGEAPSAGALLASRADQYVRHRFHEPLTTALVARRLRCNPDYLGRAFRAAYGKTLTHLIHERRVHHARKLLLESNLNVGEISRECGFDDAGYFRRVFKRQEGMTPLAYRRLYARAHVNTE
jgi:AraC-like DNA-binding protein